MTKAIPEGFHSVTPMCMFKDAFGCRWMLATHTNDLTMQEIQQGAQAFFANNEVTRQTAWTRMAAEDDSRALDLVFAKDNDINPAKETHMHALSITFEDSDHIVQKWTYFEKGKAKGVVTLKLARVR